MESRSSFTSVTQVYEVDLDKKGGAQTEVDLGDDDPEGGGSLQLMQPLRGYLGRQATQRSRRYITYGWLCRSPRSGCMSSQLPPFCVNLLDRPWVGSCSAPLFTFTHLRLLLSEPFSRMNILTQDVPSLTSRHVLHLYLRR